MVVGVGADSAVETRHGFGVVIENFRTGLYDNMEGFPVPFKVRDEDFDCTSGLIFSGFRDAFGEDAGTPIGEVITVNGGNNDVFEFQMGDSFADASRFIGINSAAGRAFLDGAKHTPPRTNIT